MNSLQLRRARADQGDHWPGFVDALATLLLVVIFLLSLFAVSQFALGRALSGRDAELARLHIRLNELAEALALEEARGEELEGQIARLRITLESTEAERDQLQGALGEAETRIVVLEEDLEAEKELSDAARSEIAALNAQLAALNTQLATLNEALEAAEKKDREQRAKIENLSQRLNAALARKVQELDRIRSEFFAALLEALGDRSDVRVVGDRFVFETDVLFASGSADLNPAGLDQLDSIAEIINDIRGDIPSDIDWIIRVDGHTDVVPIRDRYASNWELSAARAISVVNFFEQKGVPSKRLVAAGFGQYHPLDPRNSAEAYARNRRIELKLDSR